MSIWDSICAHISETRGEPFRCQTPQPGRGGCINDSYILNDDERRYFVKLNRRELGDMFEAEAAGLNEIANSHSIRVPQVICSGEAADGAYLVLEYLAFGHGNDRSHHQLGCDLARLHQQTQGQFGWWRNNTIGSTTQINTPSHSWPDFWRQHRLQFQLQLAAQNGYPQLYQEAHTLLDRLEVFFDGYTPQASLLHGDLWSGNYAFSAEGEPVIFDPAVYYGDRETDLAMTELFGGFPPAFYHAYQQTWPLDEGYSRRKHLYNLYHILNHVNLFGGSYAQQAHTMIRDLSTLCR